MRTQEHVGDPADETARRDLVARLDRLSTWPLPYAYLIIIGIGFLFTFFDIFDINVSFIQTCIALKPGCTPETARRRWRCRESVPLLARVSWIPRPGWPYRFTTGSSSYCFNWDHSRSLLPLESAALQYGGGFPKISLGHRSHAIDHSDWCGGSRGHHQGA